MIRIDTYLPLKYRSQDIRDEILGILPVRKEDVKDFRLLRLSLDTSDKKNIRYKAAVGVSLECELEEKLKLRKKIVREVPSFEFEYKKYRADGLSPVVVGAGPCGLFAALALAEAGAAPVILERGDRVEERISHIARFNASGVLNPECNVQFGEGGAGAFSDGKLKVGSPDKYKLKILNEFIEAGATEDIAYSATAHLGTDRLPDIVRRLREKIERNGGRFVYGARFCEIITGSDGLPRAVGYVKDGEKHTIECTDVILATGHSARDTMEYLYGSGFRMVARGFGIGMRIEHPREYINELVYGRGYDSSLESASYHLVTHLDSGRSVYSFCMCPGGTVVAAASDADGIVTNGMSVYARDGENSNSALLVSVTPEDFGSSHPLAGIELQRKIERAAMLASLSHSAPCLRLSEIMDGSAPNGTFGSVRPSYPLSTVPISPEKYLPECVVGSLRESMADFDAWMPGFYLPDAVLTGPETRTTSPVRILRDEETRCAVGHDRVYPCGEGAGYAGGIVSSALDGIRSALALLEKTL